jgi:Protein of unknown function (DUF3024)
VSPDPREVGLAAVEAFCQSRVPEDLRNEIRVECSRRGNSITMIERRPPWKPELAGPEWISIDVAQLRYDASGQWALYWHDSDERWWPYDDVGPCASVGPLLGEIDADPTGIFWG